LLQAQKLSCQDCFAVCKFSCRYTRYRLQQADCNSLKQEKQQQQLVQQSQCRRRHHANTPCNCLNQRKQQQQLVQQSQCSRRQHANTPSSVVAIAYHAEGEDSEAATANPAVVHCARSGIVSHQLHSCQNRLSHLSFAQMYKNVVA